MILFLLLACREPPIPHAQQDLDLDGVLSADDCNDESSAVGLPPAWYEDADGDGWGADAGEAACTLPEGYAAQTGDCDDADPASHPDAEERCDELDNDCDGRVDEDLPLYTWYPDADGDGAGASSPLVQACGAPEGYVAEPDDCDDTDPSLSSDCP